MKKIMLLLISVFLLASCGKTSYSKRGSYIIKNGKIELKDQVILGEYNYFDGYYTLIFSLEGSYELNFESNDHRVKAYIDSDSGIEIAVLDEVNNKAEINNYNGKVYVKFQADESKDGFKLEINEKGRGNE